MSATFPKNAVIIVGYKNSGDVRDCVSALATATAEPDFDILVCENGGVEAFRELFVELTSSNGPCSPLPENGEALFSPTDRLVEIRCLLLVGRSSRLWMARADRNLGYAGAINAWITSLSRFPDWEGIWILNPDTEPYADALKMLVEAATSTHKGMIGSTILRYYDQTRVHCRGGLHWRKLMCRPKLIGFNDPLEKPCNIEEIEAALDAPSGSSMYVTRACIERIGLMDERFFLYYEDLDWAARAKQCGLGCAMGSLVPHKGGTATGSSTSRARRSRMSVYLENRNRIHFVRQHYHKYLILTVILSAAYSLEYLLAGSLSNCVAALSGLIAGVRGETGPPSDLGPRIPTG